jgi:hypothetical protein
LAASRFKPCGAGFLCVLGSHQAEDNVGGCFKSGPRYHIEAPDALPVRSQ